MSRQLHCRDVSKILLWSVENSLNQSTANFGRISNSIEISFMGRAHELPELTETGLGKPYTYYLDPKVVGEYIKQNALYV